MKIKRPKFLNRSKVFIIAEIGINHGGKLKNCVKLIKSAAMAGADAAKLQITDPDTSYEKGTRSYNEFKNKTFSLKKLQYLKKISKKYRILFFATPGDFNSLKTVKKLNLKIIKISSGLLTNLPLIKEAAKLKKPMILSTGMAYKNEIKQALGIAKKFIKKNNLALLKCTSIYPASYKNLNLKSIKTFKRDFGVPIGYSDHSLGYEATLTAVGLGANVIEKHFTLNKKAKGADHHISLEPKEFKKMVEMIRNIELSLGSEIIKPVKDEIKQRKKFHRYLVASQNLKKGLIIKREHINTQRVKNLNKNTFEAKKLEILIGKK